MSGLDSNLKIQTWIDQIRDNLTNISNAPAQPPHQLALANALNYLTSASDQLAEQVTPQQFHLIDELGGSRYFDPQLARQLKAEIAANAMTPTIPRDMVQKFSSERANFISTLNNMINGLDALGIKGEVLEPGIADVSFAIPGELFENNLGSFAKELIFIDRLMRDLGEALTGNSEAIRLESLYSSTPTVAVTAGIKVIASLADLVGKFLTAWDKVVKYREARETLTKLGLSSKAIEEVSDEINTTIEEVVDESVEFILAGYSADVGRKNELSNALTQDTRRLFGQIERGLTIQFRAEPKKDADDDDAAALSTIHEAAQKISYPPIQSEPMLLANGVIVEGNVPIFKYIKKTTSKKTIRTTGN
jgi:hypothetical protein